MEKGLTVEELRDALAEMPADSQVFVSQLCMGRISKEQIIYDEATHLTHIKQKTLNYGSTGNKN